MKFAMTSLAKPPKETRPWALWIWNLSIKKSEMLSQLKSFAEKGFAGVAIRCGQDVDPPFLSEEFFVHLGDVLATAQELGLSVRLVEDFSATWSDVFAPLLLRDVSARAQRLTLVSSIVVAGGAAFEKSFENTHELLAAAVKLNGNGKSDLEQVRPLSFTKGVLSWKAPAGEWRILILKREFVRTAKGGYAPNPFAIHIADFYTKTVLEEVKGRFSKLVPDVFEGFVTELPSPLPHEKSIPWHDEIATKYKSKHKKEMLPLIVSAFVDVDPAQTRYRLQLHELLITSIYENIAGPLEAWAKKYRLSQWVLCPERSMRSEQGIERTLFPIPDSSLSCVGFQNLDGSEKNFAGLRALADMNTNQFRRKTITVIGRNSLGISSSVQDLKSEIDRTIHHGPSTILIDGFFANLDRHRHGSSAFSPSWYSNEGESIQALCEYSARLQVLFGAAHYGRDVAILMPSAAMLSDLWVNSTETVPKGLGVFEKVISELEQRGVTFDVVSEELLLSCAIRTNGEFGTADRIRKGSYRALVIPYSWLVSKGVVGYAEKIAAKKGRVLFVDDAPQGSLEDGISQAFSVRIEKLLALKECVQVCHVKDLREILEEFITPTASITIQGKQVDDVACSVGSVPGFEAYVFQNTSPTQEYSTTIDVASEKHACLLDSVTGTLEEIDTFRIVEDCGSFPLNFLPRQTHVVLTSSTKLAAPHKGRKSLAPMASRPKNYRVILKNEWEFVPGSYNVLPLAAWNARIGLSREYGGYSHFYEAYFEIKDLPTQCLLLSGDIPGQGWDANEGDARVEVTVNGSHIEGVRKYLVPPKESLPEDPIPAIISANPYMKGAIAYDIRGALDKGFNRVTIRTAGVRGEPPVIVYPPIVAGDFAIEKGLRGWTITMQRLSVASDTWTNYGYPYLAGIGVYRQIFEIPTEYKQLILRCTQVSGAVQVLLNGKDLGVSPWPPYQFDITTACESKRNELVIRVTNTIDNMLKLTRRPSGIRGEVHLDVY